MAPEVWNLANLRALKKRFDAAGASELAGLENSLLVSAIHYAQKWGRHRKKNNMAGRRYRARLRREKEGA